VAVDLEDEETIRAAAAQFEAGAIDHVVSVAAARAMGRVTELTRDAMVTALNAKIIAPILLAKHFTPLMPDTGSLLFFAGVGGWRPMPGGTVMAAGNGGVASLVAAMAVELAPLRVNAVSPGTINTSAWDALPNKAEVFDHVAATNPARRIGTVEDVAAAATSLLVNPFATGETLHLDGGARWA
jgi:NAD(P)-dependent dehydrogenase (short-subunit alcohol dehydrogenase family)